MFIVLFGVLLAVTCDGARILVLAPFPAKSHFIVMEPLFQELAARGHQVTVYSLYPQKKPLSNYTDIDLSAYVTPLVNSFTVDVVKKILPNPWMTTHFINNAHTTACNILKEPELQKLMKMKNQYDLVITELFGSDCFTYFAHRFNIPLISYTTCVALPWGSERVGLPDNPSYIPNFLVNLKPEMTLWERIYNTAVLIYTKYWHLYIFSKNTHTQSERFFGESLPPVHKLVANTSLLLVNSYHTLSQSRPFPPNVIEVGGIHIKKRQPLPKDLQTVLDQAKNGAIIMSFGSMFVISSLPQPVIEMFMNVFAKIPQTVILKYEGDLPKVPPNVIIKKWLPQRDMIEHENVVAAILHGGLSSTIEAVYFGKPLLGFPLFGDQPMIINTIVWRGAGIMLDIDNISEEKIAMAVSEILNNPKYTRNMKQLSQQFRDRPLTALDTAVFWTEYVIRHKGAPHLRPVSVNLPFYQYLLLDVFTVFFTSFIVAIGCIYVIFKWVVSALTMGYNKFIDTNLKKTN